MIETLALIAWHGIALGFGYVVIAWLLGALRARRREAGRGVGRGAPDSTTPQPPPGSRQDSPPRSPLRSPPDSPPHSLTPPAGGLRLAPGPCSAAEHNRRAIAAMLHAEGATNEARAAAIAGGDPSVSFERAMAAYQTFLVETIAATRALRDEQGAGHAGRR